MLIHITIDTANPSKRDAEVIAAIGGRRVTTIGGYQTELIGKPVRTETIAPTPAIAPDDKPDVGDTTDDPAHMGFGKNVVHTIPPQTPETLIALNAAGKIAPPPPPPPPAPNVSAGTATVQVVASASTVQLDKLGTPWSAEIHSSPATIRTNGEWRVKRGADKGFVATKSEELRRIAAISAPIIVSNETTAPGEVHAASAPHVPTPPPPPPPAPPAADTAFSRMMAAITPYIKSPQTPDAKLTLAQVQECARLTGLVNAAGVGDLGLLQYREDLIPVFGQHFNAALAA